MIAVATPTMLPVPMVAVRAVMKACRGGKAPLAPVWRLAMVSRIASRKRKNCTKRSRTVKKSAVAMTTATKGYANQLPAVSM
jgi:hypothetical protein